MNELTETILRGAAEAYERTSPLCGVETTALETFPDAVRSGDLRWRDAEWMVRWYYRRHLTSRYNRRREQAEAAFRSNDWEVVKGAIESTVAIDAPGERVATLTALSGVDVGVATGMLYFTSPAHDIVLGEREWSVLKGRGHLDREYPAIPRPSDYRVYRRGCLDITDACSVDLVTLQRAIWMLGDGYQTG